MQEPGVVNDAKETYLLDTAGQLYRRTLSSCGSIHKTDKPKTDHILERKKELGTQIYQNHGAACNLIFNGRGRAIFSKIITPS